MSLIALPHIAQVLLAPVSVWLTIENGIMAGALVLAIIGVLELVDIVLVKSTSIKDYRHNIVMEEE